MTWPNSQAPRALCLFSPALPASIYCCGIYPATPWLQDPSTSWPTSLPDPMPGALGFSLTHAGSCFRRLAMAKLAALRSTGISRPLHASQKWV
jgi:hypothetical protein